MQPFFKDSDEEDLFLEIFEESEFQAGFGNSPMYSYSAFSVLFGNVP